MIIGLVRHFKVKHRNYKPFYYPEEYLQVMKEYDEADVFPINTDLNRIDWEICFSSSLKRAKKTSEYIFHNEIIFTDLLREVSLSPFTKRKVYLPWFVWHIGARIAWRNGRTSQEESRIETKERAQKVFSLITQSKRKNVLLVTHGFFMKNLVEVFTRNGFEGKLDNVPVNGKLYLYRDKLSA